MLATLFLQPSPVELLDDTLTPSASLLPDAGGQARSGFAELLRLRVDASPTMAPRYEDTLLQEGDLLPQGGNVLPQADGALLVAASRTSQQTDDGMLQGAIHVPIANQVNENLVNELKRDQQTLAAPGATPEIGLETDSVLLSERPDISLETPVAYPLLQNTPLSAPVAAVATLPLPAVAQVGLDAVTSADRARLTDGNKPEVKLTPPEIIRVTRPELAARTQDVQTTAGERAVTIPSGIGLRDRGPLVEHATKTNSEIPEKGRAGTKDYSFLTDVPKRPDALQVARPNGLIDSIHDPNGQRSVLPQTAQMSYAQFNAQPSQATVTATPHAPAAIDAGAAAATQPATDFVATPVRDLAWGQQIGERVVTLVGTHIKTAEIRLTPAELGPLHVRVSVDDGAANVTFHAQHALTREAIEQALPRLREMLADNGLTLGQTEIGEQGVAQRDKDGQAEGGMSDGAAEELHDAGMNNTGDAPQKLKSLDSLVDTFA